MSKLIKRKDGSYSPRGLWDNIRANKGSGKKPTKEMLAQERKIKKMEDGGSIPERYRNMGFSRVGQKKESTNEGKKWMVLAKKGDQYKVVHGGYKGMQDFKQHGSEQRKENFWNRMGGRDSSKATDPFSPLYWHKRLGTWEQGGQLPQYQDGGWFQKLIENLNPFTWFEDAPETYGQAFTNARNKGLDKFTWNDKEYTTALKQETAKPKVEKAVVKPTQPVTKLEEKNSAGLDEFPNELLLWQAHKESGGFQPDIISGKKLSSANAKGLAQIRPIALDEYYRLSKQPVGSIDLTNPEDNVKVQRFLMNDHYNSEAATKGNPTEEVRLAKALAFYNKGRKGVIDILNEAKQEGQDIYRSLTWIDKLPVETSDYIKKILLHKIPKYNTQFHKDTVNSPYNKLYGFKKGGIMNKLGDTSNNRRNLLKQGVGVNLYPLPFAKGGKMYKQGGIFIKPENRGKFTAWAKSKGMGVQEAASQVMANKEEYSPTIVKRANFAKNAAGWNKAQGGRMAMNYNLGNMNIEPKSYAQGGGIDNPGFNALPDFIQAKIKANMEAGGVMRYRMGGKTKFNKMC